MELIFAFIDPASVQEKRQATNDECLHCNYTQHLGNVFYSCKMDKACKDQESNETFNHSTWAYFTLAAVRLYPWTLNFTATAGLFLWFHFLNNWLSYTSVLIWFLEIQYWCDFWFRNYPPSITAKPKIETRPYKSKQFACFICVHERMCFQRKKTCSHFILMFPDYFIITAAYFPVV